MGWTLAVLGVGGALTTTVVPLVVQRTVRLWQGRGLMAPASGGYQGACVVADALPSEWDWLGRPARFTRQSAELYVLRPIWPVRACAAHAVRERSASDR